MLLTAFKTIPIFLNYFLALKSFNFNLSSGMGLLFIPLPYNQGVFNISSYVNLFEGLTFNKPLIKSLASFDI